MVPFKYQISNFLRNAGIQFAEVGDSIGFKMYGPSDQILTFIAGGDEDTNEISLITYVNPNTGRFNSSLYRIVNELNSNSDAVRLAVMDDDPRQSMYGWISMQIQYFTNLGNFDELFDRMLRMLLNQAEEVMNKV